MERLFVTGTILPRFLGEIPTNKVITYVNPICVEKTNDDGTIKFRTRLTIGGDRIQYPYSTTAVTAEMEALKLLLNCMISENSNWTTTDIYLGTDLPHEEYIRIPLRLIPESIIEFYDLKPFITNSGYFVPYTKPITGCPKLEP
jgi:hypothetical protein